MNAMHVVRDFLLSQRVSWMDVAQALEHGCPALDAQDTQTDDDLEPFHFVAYFEHENWLIYVGPNVERNRLTMIEWGRLFGDDFRPVFCRVCDKMLSFVDPDGAPMEWPLHRQPEIVPLVPARRAHEPSDQLALFVGGEA